MSTLKNQIPIAVLNFILGLMYLHEYINLKLGKFNPDGIRFFIYYLPFAVCFLGLAIYCRIGKKWETLFFALLSLLFHFIVISNKGRNIPFNGLLISSVLIFGWIVRTIYRTHKHN